MVQVKPTLGWRAALVVGLALVASAVTVFSKLVDWTVRRDIETRWIEQERYLTQLLEDRAVAQRHPFWRFLTEPSAKSTEGDAGTILGPAATWLNRGEAAEPKLVNHATRERVLRAGENWLDSPRRFDRFPVDTGLLDDLLSTSHWDLERLSPLGSAIERGAGREETDILPDIQELTIFAQMRLLAGLKSGDSVRALKATRHLAKLMVTTENLVLIQSALTLLELERRAYRVYVEKGLIEEGDWTPVDRVTNRRLARLISALSSFYAPWTPPARLALFFSKGGLAPSQCALVNDRAPRLSALRSMLYGGWPGELDLTENEASLAEIEAQALQDCRLVQRRRELKQTSFISLRPGPWLFNRLPILRQLFGVNTALELIPSLEVYRLSNAMSQGRLEDSDASP
jgi:hypothetical protein